MTLKGTWTIWWADPDVNPEQIEIHEHEGTVYNTDPVREINGVGGCPANTGITFVYASGMIRVFPWASVREARWEPAE